MRRWLPLTPLLIAGAVLRAGWVSLPERWPVHWNIRGQVDGWAPKDPLSASFPLLMGLVVALVFEVIATTVGVALASKGAPQARLARSQQDVLRVASTGINAFLGFIAVALPYGWGLGSVLVAAGLVVIFVIGGAIVSARGTIGALKAEGALPSGYSASGLYSDPNDARLMVPKLYGYGSTVNFGHPMGKPLMLLILLLTAAPLMWLFWLTQRNGV